MLLIASSNTKYNNNNKKVKLKNYKIKIHNNYKLKYQKKKI